MSNLPIACELNPRELETRRDGLLRDLIMMARASTDLDNGVRLHFPPSADCLKTIAEVVEAERRCCHFLKFVITVEPADGDISLELTGPDGTRDFLRALFEQQNYRIAEK
jgi:hypothetical protein